MGWWFCCFLFFLPGIFLGWEVLGGEGWRAARVAGGRSCPERCHPASSHSHSHFFYTCFCCWHAAGLGSLASLGSAAQAPCETAACPRGPPTDNERVAALHKCQGPVCYTRPHSPPARPRRVIVHWGGVQGRRATPAPWPPEGISASPLPPRRATPSHSIMGKGGGRRAGPMGARGPVPSALNALQMRSFSMASCEGVERGGGGPRPCAG